MTTTQAQKNLSETDLLAAWQQRVARYRAGDTGALSVGISGLGELRIFGGAGDLPVAYPVISSLEVLDTLAPDERYAVELVARTARQAVVQRRAVSAGGRLLQPWELSGQGAEALLKEPSILILNQIVGG